ncbi:DUF3253 domain-containing protein [Microvirga guangxiensis]|uniref:DUF3253 domain-containing protein n=1 Tax=Microvirga guangxiensis TaxID=549386 RepID=A0A1G5K3X5_9HYPH|nr:DUF3253 domain-containing protein [Microvirga guangxiensis]SCY95277.1 Protein of unknown function [Microvirga guangxiensis]
MTKGVNQEELERVMLALLNERGPGRSISPTDVASAVGGHRSEEWGPLMQPLRRVAVRLMKEGRIVIVRKGKPVDPDDFRGTYRLALPTTTAED